MTNNIFNDFVKNDTLNLSVEYDCWGYENNCEFNSSFSSAKMKCKKNIPHNVKQLFFDRGDFGYIKPRISSLKKICDSGNQFDSSYLECSDHLRYCTAKNIFIDLKSLNPKTTKMYKEDLIHNGEVGGNCKVKFDRNLLKSRTDQKGYLQTWGHELQYFESYDDFKVDNNNCDVIFEKPTIIMKLDASINMYHHFCDFLNLYASQHINKTFNTNIDILFWDTSVQGYHDNIFGDVWKVFSNNTPKQLIHYAGKRLCFKNALFPLLARQIMGLFYNTPIPDGCSGTGLFNSFSHHLIKRLNIPQNGPKLNKLRVTFLSRSTNFRRIVNVDKLVELLINDFGEELEVQLVDYNSKIPFLKQIEISHNTDIFIGIHGSGLTHLLFLPDWASIFEIYNCDDPNCYLDLSKLRGVKYFTWPKHLVESGIKPAFPSTTPPKNIPHKKFTNYNISEKMFKEEFVKIKEYVKRHPLFVDEQRKRRRAAALKKEKEL